MAIEFSSPVRIAFRAIRGWVRSMLVAGWRVQQMEGNTPVVIGTYYLLESDVKPFFFFFCLISSMTPSFNAGKFQRPNIFDTNPSNPITPFPPSHYMPLHTSTLVIFFACCARDNRFSEVISLLRKVYSALPKPTLSYQGL